ncbi:Enolase 2 [Ananas comosus]|uniref:phosphopyruvate hydratase n=1 Tax=Ananas comosus TaxID=4615 RepID=A0A199UPN6_ANACO|nr:Enolase 2 [Ananas comosus]
MLCNVFIYIYMLRLLSRRSMDKMLLMSAMKVVSLPIFSVVICSPFLELQESKEGLELLKAAIAKAGYTGKVVIGMDAAASEFYDEKDQTYDLNFKEEASIILLF